MGLDRFWNYVRDLRVWYALRGQWARAYRVAVQERGSDLGVKALIIPCDPWGVVGSRGDQAMILACLQHVRSRNPHRVVDILTDSHEMDAACRKLGLNPVVSWHEPMDVWFGKFAREYAEVYIPGADVTDGVYGWTTACRMLLLYDCFFARGVAVHYLGFSWSETPHPMMKWVLARLSPGVPLPVRDPVSIVRLARFTAHRPLVQVADAAFCLQPRQSTRARTHLCWIKERQASGGIVIALNVHNMFNDVATKSSDWEMRLVTVLNQVLAERPDVHLLLLPHDARPHVSDLEVLRRLSSHFSPRRSYFVDEVMDSDEIKFLVGCCDCLIAGRMHLSIAALGRGVPVLGLVYQGKFEGLWRHFNLEEHLLLDPGMFLVNPETIVERIRSFIDDRHCLSIKILGELPHVCALAELNFSNIT